MSFCSAKAPNNFSAKNITAIKFVCTVRLIEPLPNDFIKLMMQQTTRPRLIHKDFGFKNLDAYQTAFGC